MTIQEFPIDYWEEKSTPVLQQFAPTPTDYVSDVDFATMTYSGGGDATANLQAVDLLMPPTGGSTSGGEATDFAGFTPGNIALMQRGTCNFVVKSTNAQSAGATGAIIFNEGNNPGRTGLLLGTLGGPGFGIPVVGTTFALGEVLYNLAAGTPGTALIISEIVLQTQPGIILTIPRDAQRTFSEKSVSSNLNKP